MNNKNPIYLQENWYTDFLRKNRWYRDSIFKYGRKFEDSKYTFPVLLHTYGWGTMMLPSGSVYTIALGSVPRELRRKIIRKLEHAKSLDDIKEVKDVLQKYGGDVIQNVKNKIKPSTKVAANVAGAM